MTVILDLAPEDERKLADRAAASGEDVTGYVQRLIKRDIEQPSFAELFAPMHQAVRESGMGEAEIDGLVRTAVVESRRDRHAKRTS
jgi:hypothetical protein